MVLTKFIETNQEYRNLVKELIPVPRDLFNKNQPIINEPQTHWKYSALIGVCYDFLFKLYLKLENKNCIGNPVGVAQDMSGITKWKKFIDYSKTYKKIDLQEFIRTIQPHPITDMGEYNKNKNFILQDLKNLHENFIELPKSKNKIIINNRFKPNSTKITDAEADIIIDDILIDFKVTKDLKLTLKDWCQIITYYLFLRDEYEINYIGIWYARFNYLFKIPISNFSKENFEFLKNKLK